MTNHTRTEGMSMREAIIRQQERAGRAWLNQPENIRSSWGDIPTSVLADAALQALAGPTKAMVDAGDAWCNHHADDAHAIFTAMITAAQAAKE